MTVVHPLFDENRISSIEADGNDRRNTHETILGSVGTSRASPPPVKLSDRQPFIRRR